MHCHHHSATVLVAIVVGVIASTYAQAASRVGSATTVVRDVSGSLSGTSWDKKVEGDDVYENEFIQTAAKSTTALLFVDETDIKIGPAAKLKIDRVVFKSNNRSVSELIVTADAGPMRWNSGISPSSAYQVKTPTAIIKVHGTAFDLFAEPQQTTVILRRGTIEVCLIDSPQRCQTLSRSGDTIVATSNDLERPQRAGLGPSEFADRCLSADAMPCLITASISPAQPASPKRETQTYPAQPPTHTGETPVPPPGTGHCYRSRGRTICGDKPTHTGETPVPPPGTGNCNLSKGRTICGGPTQTGDTGPPPGTGHCYRSRGRTICGDKPTHTGETPVPPPGTGHCYRSRGRTICGDKPTHTGETPVPPPGTGHCYRSRGRTICGDKPTHTGETPVPPPGTGNCNLSKGRTICGGPTQTGDTGPPFGGRGRTGDGRGHTGMGPTGSPFGGRGHTGIGPTGGFKAFGLHSR